MIQCQSCGQANAQSSNFCRFCGTKFTESQVSNRNGFEYAPPRPYAWKTDEFQVADGKVRKPQPLNQARPMGNPQMNSPHVSPLAPVAYRQPDNLAYNYHCPRCAAQVYPRFEKRISNAGWIVFAVLLIIFFPLFWVGFLIKEDVKICPVCNSKVG